MIKIFTLRELEILYSFAINTDIEFSLTDEQVLVYRKLERLIKEFDA